MTLDRRAQRLLDMLAAAANAPDPDPAARRAALRALAETADDRETPAQTLDLVAPGPGGRIPLRIYAPADATSAPLPGLVYLHGGGWVAGDLETHDGLCRRLAAASGCRIVAVDYRLAPEHPFPAALEDAVAATAWTAAHASALCIDARRLAVGGDSVGGGLAAATARVARDAGDSNLALQMLICPILDVAKADGSRAALGDGHFISRAAFAQDLADYAADVSADDPRLSPGAAPEFGRLPPALIHTAEYDPFRDEGEAYAAALAAAGVPAPVTHHAGMIHYFYALARALPAAHAAAETIGAQLKAALGEDVAAA
jgi:acetyl esterase/lipase